MGALEEAGLEETIAVMTAETVLIEIREEEMIPEEILEEAVLEESRNVALGEIG